VYESESNEVEQALEAFYREIRWTLDEYGRRKGATPLGFAVPLKRLALKHGITSAEYLPLPRFSRAERATKRADDWQERQ
jgi:hypothetical protein